MYKVTLPADPDEPRGNVRPIRPVALPTTAAPASEPEEQPAEDRPGFRDRVGPAAQRFTDGWRNAWIGDGILGMRPRPVMDLVRQFWTAPPSYVRDALILRIPYAIYGAPVITFTAAAHLLLLVISYPSLLAGTGLLVLFISLFL